jgi:hypothetical protein
VVVDTAPVLDAGAPGLAADLAALGPHELHLVLGAGGTAAAPGLIAALRPARLSIGDPSDAAHVGAAVALAIEHDVPISLVASTVAAGRPDLAVNPADATSLARTLSG